MNSVVVSTKNHESDRNPVVSGDERASVLEELERILASRHFKSADRSKQFLRYVVLNKLDGDPDRLKERTIGIEVFQRPPGYATGEDPVVRVQAGEVRRRLDQHYQELLQPSLLRIDLPVGSYSPAFHFGTSHGTREVQARATISVPTPAPLRKAVLRVSFAVMIVALAAISAGVYFKPQNLNADPRTKLEEFWSPAITSQQPVLICIANATDHSAEEKILQWSYLQSRNSRAGSKRNNDSPPAGMDALLTIEGLPVSREIVPASDASVAFALSGLFGGFNRPSQLRIGTAATYEDLRNFPAVIIGGFNSKWTMQLVSNLHFAFLRENGQYMIREEVAGGRVWTTRLGPNGETTEDYAIVARLIDSKTGQFTVTVAGIGPLGTQAAGEFVTKTHFLEEGLASAPADWQNRNLEVLLQITVTDSMAGPPHVVATYAW